jgi:phage gpG-like protein
MAASKELGRWIGGYARHLLRGARRRATPGPRHLLFAFCDHWEPLWGNADRARADARVNAWARRYPELVNGFRDADGFAPRHSFFFPGEQYEHRWLEQLGELARRKLGEVELHLHHDGDTHAKLRRDLDRYLGAFAGHGHLARDASGRLRYGFIHGNWCLANARDDRRWCGVDDELELLFDTGCYADFTFPSAPDQSQPNIVNRIYWPTGDLGQRRAYERGVPARVGQVKDDRILMVQGPLALVPRRSRVPLRIENAAVTAKDPATPARIKTWVAQNIHVEGRPDWVFVKVHTHGAPEEQAASLLGDGGHALHRELTTRYNDGKAWRLHYVTAREMYNIAIAAMEGHGGNPGDYRNHRLPAPPVVSA